MPLFGNRNNEPRNSTPPPPKAEEWSPSGSRKIFIDDWSKVRSLSEPREEEDYPLSKTIIVGLGRTGEIVLNHWAARFSTKGRLPAAIRMLWIGAHEAEFRSEGISAVSLGATANSGRTTFHDRMDDVQYLQQIHAHLQVATDTLRPDVRVILCGSVAEPAISGVGIVTQLLRLLASTRDPKPFTSIVGVFTLEHPTQFSQPNEKRFTRLEDGEQIAALRELDRLKSNVINVMPRTHLTKAEQRAFIPMLDNYFLVGGHSYQSTTDIGTMQAIIEFLTVLAHPGFRTEFQSAIVTAPSNYDRYPHEIRVSTFGVSSLEAPLSTIKDYLAKQLIRDVLFDETLPGKFYNSSKESSSSSIKSLLINDSTGPANHPALKWTLRGLHSNQKLPIILGSLNDTYRTALLWAIVTRLNSTENASLQAADEELSELHDLIEDRQSDLRRRSEVGADELVHMYNHWLDITIEIQDDIRQWNRHISSSDKDSSTSTASLLAASQDTEEFNLKSEVSRDLLNVTRATSKLQTSYSSNYHFSVCTPGKSTHQDALDIYEQEFKSGQRILENTSQRIVWGPNRTRTGIELAILKEPITVWPPTRTYSIDESGDFKRALEDLVYRQIEPILEGLKQSWFTERSKHYESHLRNAATSALVFDTNSATSINEVAPSANAYTIGPGREYQSMNAALTESGAILKSQFLAGNVPGIVMALAIWHNIPLRSSPLATEMMRGYQASHSLHIYEQEKAAARYEAYSSYRDWERLMPTELVTMFAEPQYVRMLLHAYLWGVMIPIPDQLERSNPTYSWAIDLTGYDTGSASPIIRISPAYVHEDGMSTCQSFLNALRTWSLVWLYANENQIRESGSHPFNSVNHDRVMQSIRQRLVEARQQTGIDRDPTIADELYEQRVARFLTNPDDKLCRSLALMLERERLQPIPEISTRR